MPNFKQFIKGFEEEPEQPKENRDQIIEKVNRKMMNAGTYGALGDKENYEKSITEAEELRKGLAPKAEPKPAKKPNPTEVMKNADAKYKPMYEELDKKDDELYKAYYYEKDPVKKAEYKAQMEENGKKIDALIEEWEKATKPAPKPGSFDKMIEGFDEPEQKQFSKEEIALADKAAEVLSHYAWGQGFKVEKLPNGNYLTNIHLDDPDAEPQEVGPDFILQEREKLLKSGDERFAELWEEYNK